MRKMLTMLLVVSISGFAYSDPVMHFQLVEEGNPATPGHGFTPADPLAESEIVYLDILYDDLTDGNANLVNTGLLTLSIDGNASWIANNDYTWYEYFGQDNPHFPGYRSMEVIDPKTLEIGGFTDTIYTYYAIDGTVLFDHLGIHCDGPGEVTITLAPATTPNLIGVPLYEDQGDYQLYEDLEAVGGLITLYQVPEPMTITLLGLGGLGMIRRRRRM